MEKLVPKLRFSEYFEEWKPYKISDLAALLSGFAFHSGNFGVVGQKLVIPKNFTKNGYGNFLDSFSKYTTEECDVKYICNYGDILVLLTDLTTTCELLGKPLEVREQDGQLLLNQRVSKFIFTGGINPRFFKNVLLTPNYHNYVVSTSSGSTVRHSSNKLILNYGLSLPTLPEQNKIAEFLTAIDKHIELLTAKKEKLTLYKKGVMQKIFSQEIRFKPDDGGEFPEWENHLLKDVCEFINGRAYKQEELLDKGRYPVLRVGNFFTNNNWYYSDLELENKKYCSEGDLLYAWSASFGPRIWHGKKVIYHYHIWKVIPNQLIDRKFLFFLLDHETLEIKSSNANGLAMLHITKSAIEAWEVTIPTLTEQIKIEKFLSSLEFEIQKLDQQITLNQTYKKGLLQQMFV